MERDFPAGTWARCACSSADGGGANDVDGQPGDGRAERERAQLPPQLVLRPEHRAVRRTRSGSRVGSTCMGLRAAIRWDIAIPTA